VTKDDREIDLSHERVEEIRLHIPNRERGIVSPPEAETSLLDGSFGVALLLHQSQGSR
jgi:hypothetical protein